MSLNRLKSAVNGYTFDFGTPIKKQTTKQSIFKMKNRMKHFLIQIGKVLKPLNYVIWWESR